MNSLKRNRNGNISFISPLYNWSSYMLQTPPYDFNKKSMNITKSVKFATFAYTFALILSFGLTIYGKVNIIFEIDLSIATILIDGILLIVQVTVSLLISISSIFQCDDLKMFFKIFETIDARLNIDEENKHNSTYNFFAEILLLHCLYFLVVIYDAYVWNSCTPVIFYLLLLLRSVLHYPYTLFCLLTWNFVLAIYVRFKLLNKYLKYSKYAYIYQENAKGNKVIAGIYLTKTMNVRELSNIYRSLSKLIQLFNKIYGGKIFLMLIWVVLGNLIAVSLGLVYGKTGNFLGANYGHHLLILCCTVWPMFINVSKTFSFNAKKSNYLYISFSFFH